MSITTNELAKLCKVSRGTVDRALNGRAGISDATRKLILEMAEKHHYVPHKLASSLATGKTHSVGIIVFDLNNRHFAQIIDAIEQYLEQYGIFCYTCITHKNQARELELVRELISRHVDGLIIVPINRSDTLTPLLMSWGRPVVTINNFLDDHFSFIGGNGEQAIYNGMKHFYNFGFRCIHFLCPPYRNLGKENLYAQIARVNGFRHFQKEFPLVSGKIIDDSDYLHILLQEIAQSIENKIGVLCCSDHYALKLYKAARQMGMSPPDDYGLMGFDGIDTLDYMDRSISTILYPVGEIGKLAASVLYGMMQGTNLAEHITLECPIKPGNTI